MQSFATLLMTAAIAASAPVGQGSLMPASDVQPSAEAYVALLDADWNVTREARASCSSEVGCVVDLALDGPALAAVHVRFDAPKAGAVAVRSRLEDRDGRASAAEDESLALDRTGFAAGHYEARMTPAGGDGRIIMMAVRMPGWTAPGPSVARPAADRT